MKKDILFSYIITVLFALISISFIYYVKIEHDKQKENLKIVEVEKARAQFNNLSSLISLETALTKEASLDHGKSMLAFKLIEKRNNDFVNYFNLTSLKPLNSKNTPDKFEKRGLSKFKNSAEIYEYYEFSENELYYIGKLNIEESCLKCHSHQGYKLGDIRGGLRVTMPLASFNEKIKIIDQENNTELIYIFSYIVLIFLSLILFFFYSRKNTQTIEKINLSLEDKVQKRTKQLENNHLQVITSFIKLIEQRDPYTAGHSERVAKYSVKIAQKINLNKEEIEIIRQAAVLHDVGKISIPDNLLLKPDKLNNTEYSLIQDHSTLGYAILDSIDEYKDIAKIVRHHHERYDGSGYPDRLKEAKIPLASQIIALADTFDAMTTNRIYKPRKTVKEAIDELKTLSGTHFEPILLEKGINALENLDIEFTSQLPNGKSDDLRFAYFFKDPLTKLYNEKYLNMKLTQEFEKYKEYYFTLIIVKNFTKYNEQNGWTKGNRFLIETAEILNNIIPNAINCRFEGDDFILLHQDRFDKKLFEKFLLKNEVVTYEVYQYIVIDEINTIKQIINN